MAKSKGKVLGGNKPLSFAGLFALVAVIEYLLFYQFAPEILVNGLIEANARLLYTIVKATGAPVTLVAETLTFPNMQLRIVYECTGGFAMFIFSACVIAFPSTLRSKLLGHVIGAIGIFAINLGRLLVLAWAALHARGIFDFIHKYLWQATFIILVLALWAVWVNRFTGKKRDERTK